MMWIRCKTQRKYNNKESFENETLFLFRKRPRGRPISDQEKCHTEARKNRGRN